MAGKARCRVGIDVGGTFTDFVLTDVSTGALTYFKEPSVPADPSLAVERGMQGLLKRAKLAPADVELVVHGTTLGVNAIIQRRGARIALVASRGNRDVLEIARCRMPSSYDLHAAKEEPLVPRDLVFEVAARGRPDGSAAVEPSDQALADLARAIAATGVSAVAVMLLNSYANPALERRVAQSLRAHLPGILVSCSADVWPEIREYERALVATLNAYIHPLLERYYTTLRERMDRIGVLAPLYITASNGGSLSLDSARARPIETVMSGPASGVVAAARTAAVARSPRIITFDMGGTSSDIAVSEGGEPEYTTRTMIGDFPLVLPVVNVSSIGAGGGSLVWVDAHGVLKVGPDSAGADPGPICYRRGGTQPTVTDCYVAAGVIDPGAFLGGRMTLDKDAAVAALDAVAQRIGLAGADRAAQAAEAALNVATARMATELFKGLAQRGLDPRGFALVPFGGAGPTHSNLLAEEARLNTIVVPPAPGTFCAMGAILADIKRDYVRTVRRRLDAAVARQLDDLFATMIKDARAWLDREGKIVGATAVVRDADMRYVGQAYELQVSIPERKDGANAAELAELFHQAHERVYGFRDAQSPVEITTVRLRIVGKVPPVAAPASSPGAGAPVPYARRRVFQRGQWIEAAVHRRGDLHPGQSFAGPALIEQEDTTTWMLAGWRARVDDGGNLHITRA
ncbi:MAG: hydantoinase/oxoprolinase family protein [Alphaproteobacteria bacterium]|nr:hydantoinase/oxoprolinase family protein [Alphaproteobacteria bacterium]